MKKTVIILLPLVWSYRNFYLTGIIQNLEEKFTVYLAVSQTGYKSFINNGISKKQLIILNRPAKTIFSNWLFKLCKKIHSHLHPSNTARIFQSFLQVDSFKSKLKDFVIFKLPMFFLGNRIGFAWVQKLENYFFNKANIYKFANLLNEIKPAFVLSTASVVDTEWSLFRTAQKMKIPTIAHVLSFDNITSRGYLPIHDFDYYMVWNIQMKDELVGLYNIKPNQIQITGTPQFDFHIKKEYLWGKNETLAELGFKETDRYFLYCANHFNISPTEPELLQELIQSVELRFPELKVVLRLHPMDKYERWDDLISSFPNLVLSIPWAHDNSDAIYWGEPTLHDLVSFSNILRYAEVMLNIASTVSIDASITDTPTVCVGFDPSNAKESKFYHDVHFSEHYKPIMDMKATPLALNIEMLIDLIEEQINQRDKYSSQRRSMVDYFLPPNKSTASDRIVNTLEKFS